MGTRLCEILDEDWYKGDCTRFENAPILRVSDHSTGTLFVHPSSPAPLTLSVVLVSYCAIRIPFVGLTPS